MASLTHHDIVSIRSVVMLKHGQSDAVDDFAGRLLDILRAYHCKNAAWNEKQATAIEKDMDEIAGEG